MTPSREDPTEKRLELFNARHGEAAKALQAQTTALAARVGMLGRSSRVLHPEKTRNLWMWDVVTSIALLYTATLTPFETAFVPPVLGPGAWGDVWFLLNRLLDIIFLVDLNMQFFIAYAEGNDFAGRVWVEDHKKIIVHYLTTWFALDATTVFLPGSFDLYLASADLEGDDGGAAAERLGSLRVLRALRLIKLVRLVRASRVFERWRAKITLSYANQTIMQLVLVVLFTSHWYACVIALSASLHSSAHETLAGEELYGLCGAPQKPPIESGGTAAAASGVQEVLAGCSRLSLGKWYLATYAWSVFIITGTGGTDFYPSAASSAETVPSASSPTRTCSELVASRGAPSSRFHAPSLLETNGL